MAKKPTAKTTRPTANHADDSSCKYWVERDGVLRPFQFGYDAVEDSGKKRRRPIRTSVSSEDNQLLPYQRRKMISATRDLERNFSVASWAIRKHMDYVATFSFQVRTADQAFNRRLEQLFIWWSQPQNCDIAGRHSLSRFIRLAEQSRTVDGDVLVLFLKNGKMQAIESDRIDTPTGLFAAPSDRTVTNGVEVDADGRAIAYAVSKRTTYAGLEFERWVSSEFAHLLGYYDRFDQVRGISRLAPAINTFQDLYEGIGYAIAKAKVAQLFGLITYRESSDPMGTLSQDDMDQPRYNVNFGSGPFHLDLDDGDRAEILESKTPSVEFQQFVQQMIASAIKSLDIPFSFYDESFTNYSGARQALLQYEQSVRAKRDDVVELLDRITSWKIFQWSAAGLLTLPDGMLVTEVPWEWIPVGIPWIDPMREIGADVMAIKAGIRSRQQICKERGYDFMDTAKQLGDEKILLESMGLPVDPAISTSASTSITEQVDADSEVNSQDEQVNGREDE